MQGLKVHSQDSCKMLLVVHGTISLALKRHRSYLMINSHLAAPLKHRFGVEFTVLYLEMSLVKKKKVQIKIKVSKSSRFLTGRETKRPIEKITRKRHEPQTILQVKDKNSI